MRLIFVCLSMFALLGLAACDDRATEGDAGQAARQEAVPDPTTPSGTEEGGGTAQATN